MLDQEKKIKIQNIVQSLIEKMGFSSSVDVLDYFEGTRFNIKTSDGGILIGDRGEHIKSFNHIVRRLAEKEFGHGEENTPLHFIVDVNDYYKERSDYLHELARMSAQRVRYFKKEVEMKPMSAFERRIIHTALMEYPDIKTESRGEGMERRVVIKPL